MYTFYKIIFPKGNDATSNQFIEISANNDAYLMDYNNPNYKSNVYNLKMPTLNIKLVSQFGYIPGDILINGKKQNIDIFSEGLREKIIDSYEVNEDIKITLTEPTKRYDSITITKFKMIVGSIDEGYNTSYGFDTKENYLGSLSNKGVFTFNYKDKEHIGYIHSLKLNVNYYGDYNTDFDINFYIETEFGIKFKYKKMEIDYNTSGAIYYSEIADMFMKAYNDNEPIEVEFYTYP